jgi:LPS-assembly lipoprotein
MSKMPHANPTSLVMLLLVAMVTGGCGFHLRGEAPLLNPDNIPSPLYVNGPGLDSALRSAVVLQLRQAGVALTDSSADAAATLRLRSPSSGSRLLSVDSRNKAVEYELTESVSMALVSASGETLIEPQQISVTRIQYRPDDAILAGANEEELLRSEMRGDLANRVLIRLAAR